ncbi:hypothetical protein ACN2XU_03040 [Primorskyibacter sp. 2E107]|uniref:hypothetical protein n=1 Tax=Primorskyibacter sp. 2E107 TaxID=3403458 RepID=UPI003AF68FDE
MGKVWWRSKTVWFNVLMAVVAFADELTPLIDQLVASGYEAEWIAPVRSGIALITIVGNMILRALTNEPVRLR